MASSDGSSQAQQGSEGQPWHNLQREWVASDEEIMNIPHSMLAPAWRMLLSGDGSPTRTLQLLSGNKTAVDVIDMSAIGSTLDGAPACVEQITAPRLRRQVWLENTCGERMGYAVSWWNEALVQQHLQDAKLPIWVSLAQRKTETFRQILAVYRGTSPELEAAFGHKGPFWGRHYFFWREGAPLTLIYEVFSPQLEAYLGPQVLPAAPAASDMAGQCTESAAQESAST